MAGHRYLILGTGVGKAIAYVLLSGSEGNLVTLADTDLKRAFDVRDRICKIINRRCICTPMEFRVGDKDTVSLFGHFDAVISALPAKYNLELAEAAINANVHFCDLGGVVEITQKIVELNKKYRRIKKSIITDCGLMPGLGNLLAKKLGGRDIEILVGGIPQKPRPPVYYQRVFSIEGLKHICYGKVPVLKNGNIEFEEPLSRWAEIEVPELKPFSKLFDGDVEIFATSGASIAPWIFRDWGFRNFVEKTVRWPGFVKFVRNIPEEKFEKTMEPHINTPVDAENPDLVWMRVQSTDVIDGERKITSYELLDLFDPKTGLSAMERTTGFTTAVIAEMMAEGRLARGVNTPECAFDLPTTDATDMLIERLGAYFKIEKID